jgi:Ca2+-binding RTX toxin-like protein
MIWQMEALESRQHFADIGVAMSEYSSGKVVTISTGDEADNVSLSSRTTVDAINPAVSTLTLVIIHNGTKQLFSYTSSSSSDSVIEVRLKTGAGNDRVTVVNFDDVSMGTPWIDVKAGDGNDMVSANGGFVIVEGERGNDLIVGTTSVKPAPGYFAFSFSGGPGNDAITGSDQPDAMIGNEGNDTLVAGDGDDYIQFGEADKVLAGGGNDYLVKDYNDLGHAIVSGGAGFDTLAVFTGGQNLPLDTTFSNLLISSVEEYTIDRLG